MNGMMVGLAACFLSLATAAVASPQVVSLPASMGGDWRSSYEETLEVYGASANARAIQLVEEGRLQVAIASWWGFDSQDATATLQAAFDSKASLVVIPVMETDWIVTPLHVNRNDKTLVFLPGTILRAKKGAYRSRNASMLNLVGRERISIIGYGASWIMRKKDYWEEPYAKSEWRNTLTVRGCRDLKIEGLTFKDSGGDGIYIGSTSEVRASTNVVIRDVVSDGHHRQGISVISAENLLIENCVLSGTRGTAPMAGIDLEPNRADERLVNVVIRRCLIASNDQLGAHTFLNPMDATSEPVSILWEENVIEGGEIGIHISYVPDDVRGTITYRNNRVFNSLHAGILLRMISSERKMKIRFENNLLVNTARRDREYDQETIRFYQDRFNLEHPSRWWGGMPSAPIVLHAQLPRAPKQGLVSFQGDRVIHGGEGPSLVISGAREKGFEGWYGIEGYILTTASGSMVDVRVPLFQSDLLVNPIPVQTPD